MIEFKIMTKTKTHGLTGKPSNATKKHGGARSGSGAPTHSNLGEKIMRSYRLAPDVIAILDAHRPAGPTIEKAVREYAQRLELENQ